PLVHPRVELRAELGRGPRVLARPRPHAGGDGPARAGGGEAARRAGHVGCDQLPEVPLVPPRELELLRAPEVHLDVVLDGEAVSAPDLLTRGGDVAVGLTGEELGHGREARDRAPLA